MNPSVDLFGTTDHLVIDAKTRCRESSREPGGGGINVARNLAMLGHGVHTVFPAGGGNGQLLETLLCRESIPYESICVANETRQNLALTETATGRMVHLVFPGAALTRDEWQSCDAAIQRAMARAPYLVLSGSLPPGAPEDLYARLTEAAKAHAIRVVLDTSGAPLAAAVGRGVHLIKLNRKELAQLGYTGDWTPESQLEAMAQMVQEGAADNLVVTQGDQGALLATSAGGRFRAVPPPVTVVSHVGAGDSFVALMVHSLIRQAPMADALAQGVAGAAAAISTDGNRIRDRFHIESLLNNVSC
ncbi:hexose kinase [Halomonas sp. 22501_18_FS]|uniref:Phosphofructokinase n=2 Tax=Oceanospirillales TaxID=135619 RepID=A0A9X4YEW3_9GAMM|nr:hexose kinase [Halomonas utahensis]MYL74966.1 hexose kinase [Halomonas sp. 22501_18_FS]